jgi:rod shape-determining protein MreB
VPCELTISSLDICDLLRRSARVIAEEVVSLLEVTSPELVSDIMENGITLTGGGSQLSGIAQVIEKRTKIHCTVADDPSSCVVYGCGKILPYISHMKTGPINISKRRLMRE